MTGDLEFFGSPALRADLFPEPHLYAFLVIGIPGSLFEILFPRDGFARVSRIDTFNAGFRLLLTGSEHEGTHGHLFVMFLGGKRRGSRDPKQDDG